jgi:hypothetical protein
MLSVQLKTCCKFSLLSLSILFTTIAWSQQSACSLLQSSEMESALGGKAGNFTDNSMGKTSICTGQVGTRKVMIRFAERKNANGNIEKSAVEMLRKQGWKIDVKQDGNVTCSTAIPPAGSGHTGFNTTCSILSNGKVVAVEVTSLSKAEMASMDVVRALAQKAASRL